MGVGWPGGWGWGVCRLEEGHTGEILVGVPQGAGLRQGAACKECVWGGDPGTRKGRKPVQDAALLGRSLPRATGIQLHWGSGGRVRVTPKLFHPRIEEARALVL